MHTAPGHEIASAILVDILGRFLFQRRDDVPGILSPGKIGLFGGHLETGGTYLQCVVREVHEEIGYFLRPERFWYLAPYQRVDPVHGRIRVNSSSPVKCQPISFGSPKGLFLWPSAETLRLWSRSSRRRRWSPCELFRWIIGPTPTILAVARTHLTLLRWELRGRACFGSSKSLWRHGYAAPCHFGQTKWQGASGAARRSGTSRRAALFYSRLPLHHTL